MRFLAVLLAVAAAVGAAPKTRNVVLVTCDGLRWQDLFGGIDPVLMNEKAAGMAGAKALRDKLWRESPKDRRETLAPFFWKQLVPKGAILKNVQVTNGYRVSYPGYSEILTGRAQDESIKGNAEIQNPTETVLEFAKRKLSLSKGQVALFASWGAFQWIGEKTPGSIVLNSGYRDSDATPRIAELSRMQHDLLTPFGGARHDYVTFEMAMDYLRAVKPRMLYIALDETDDWAHAKRYDLVLQNIQWIDRSIERLWTALQKMPQYRGTTTLIITSDHGRGSTINDWDGHGSKVNGAEKIWLAMIGPDTPATGESAVEAKQRDIAPTILELLGVDWRDYAGVAGKPIAIQ